MNRTIIFIILLYSLLFCSCTKRNKLMFDNKANHYEIIYLKNDIVISKIRHSQIEKSDTLLLHDGEYIDCAKQAVILSTKQTYNETLDSIFVDKLTYYKMSIHKLNDYSGELDLKKKQKDIFVTEYYLEAYDSKDDKRVMKAYYYDEDYKLLKIIEKSNKEFCVE